MLLKHLYTYAVEFKVLVRENHRIVFMTNKRVRCGQDECQGQQKLSLAFMCYECNFTSDHTAEEVGHG